MHSFIIQIILYEVIKEDIKRWVKQQEKEVGSGKLSAREVISMALSLRAWGRWRPMAGSCKFLPEPFCLLHHGHLPRLFHKAAYIDYDLIIIYLRL